MKTKILFIYNDQVNFSTIDFSYIKHIVTELNYEIVLVTNQINLGTEKLPRVIFNKSHDFILKNIKNEEFYLSFVYITPIQFYCILEILLKYFSKIYNCYQSFVLSNKIIMGINEYLQKEDFALYLNTSLKSKYKIIYNLLKFNFNECSYRRRSKETDIQIFIKIDNKGISNIQTGFGFFDHILDQICIHSNIDLGIKVKGDIHIDEHHTIEDTAISIGLALGKSLKDKRGIARYGFFLPMDDVLAQVSLDLGGRSNLIWKSNFEREKIGNVPTEMFEHFFKSFSDVVNCNLHIQTEGKNEHHKIEAIFKAFACSLKMGTNRNNYINRLPSTKEIL